MDKRTVLYQKHVELGGKIVSFAGWELPVSYKNGILHEHAVVREKAGLFDVSHMGEIMITGENATEALQKLVSNRVADMQCGQCRYALLPYADGGIVDDLLIYKFSDNKYLLVVNASNADKDFAHITENLSVGAKAENISDKVSQVALQGPLAEKIMAKVCDSSLLPVKNYRFVPEITVAGKKCLVSTTGYTGEKGYEIYAANADIVEIYDSLMAAGEEFGLEPIGLGARDTLRFESCMPLYGHELSKDYKLNEVGLDFAIKHGLGYLGEMPENAVPEYTRAGIKLIDKGVAREHVDLFDEAGDKIGITTSGGVCPTLGGSYAMVRILKKYENLDCVFVKVRDKLLKAEFVQMPFYKRTDK